MSFDQSHIDAISPETIIDEKTVKGRIMRLPKKLVNSGTRRIDVPIEPKLYQMVTTDSKYMAIPIVKTAPPR